MALRPVRAPDLTRRRARVLPRVRVQPRPTPQDDQGSQDLRLRRGWLFVLCLVVPLLAAFYGFTAAGVRLPSPSPLLGEAPLRGTLYAADGTVLAEGDAQTRSYPQGTLAAQLIGFSGAEQPDKTFGLEGLERKLDSTLQAGQDVTLTLDPDVQGIVQTELEYAAKLHGAKNGAMVMLEAGTGRILASASYPTFDPNTQRTLVGDSRNVIGNAPMMASVEPGSIMKPFVVAALLQDRKLEADEVLPVAMQRRVGSKTFTDVTEHEPTLAISDILRYSSNVGMIELGERFTSPELAAWYHRYGFGQPVATKAVSNADGIVNPPETWVPQDHASAVIGQSMAATALQLAAAYSIFANDGVYVTPQVLESEVGAAATEQILDPAVARTVRGMLTYTVENSGLKDAKIPGVEVAGKSGSADLFDTDKGEYIDAGTLTFAGMFPADNPRVIGVIYLQRVKEENPLSVSVTAPAFRRIGSQTVALWDEAALSGH